MSNTEEGNKVKSPRFFTSYLKGEYNSFKVNPTKSEYPDLRPDFLPQGVFKPSVMLELKKFFFIQVLEPTFHSPEKDKKKNPLENILNFVSGLELPSSGEDGARSSPSGRVIYCEFRSFLELITLKRHF